MSGGRGQNTYVKCENEFEPSAHIMTLSHMQVLLIHTASLLQPLNKWERVEYILLIPFPCLLSSSLFTRRTRWQFFYISPKVREWLQHMMTEPLQQETSSESTKKTTMYMWRRMLRIHLTETLTFIHQRSKNNKEDKEAAELVGICGL